MNENYAQPSLPEGVEQDIVKGLYRYAEHDLADAKGRVHLLGSGTILREVIAAAELLQHDWQIASDVWSATSYSELARDAREVERCNRLHPEAPRRTSHVQACLGGALPIVAASDYVRAWPQLVAGHAGAPFVALGTDGFGRSDTRAELRRFFEIDRHQIVLAALDSLVSSGRLAPVVCAEAIRRYGIATDEAAPWAV